MYGQVKNYQLEEAIVQRLDALKKNKSEFHK